MIIEEEVYLEHFGVKGMHWGVRNKRGGTQEQRRSGNKKFVRNLAIGSAVGIGGGLAVAALMKHHGQLKAKQIVRSQENIRRMGENFAKSSLKQSVFSAKMPDGKTVFYGKHAEEAFRKAGAFDAIPLGPIGSTSVSRLRGAIPMPRIRR